MFPIIIKRYFLIFFVFFSSYTLFNWLVIASIGIPAINEEIVSYWAPVVISYTISWFFFKPIIMNSAFKASAKRILLWILIPLSMVFSINMTYYYIRDISFSLVIIDKPSDIKLHPHDLFFKVNSFYASSNKYSEYFHKRRAGIRNPELHLNYYFVTPMYNDSLNRFISSGIGIGISYSKTLNDNLFAKSGQHKKITDFLSESLQKYFNYNYYDSGYFEKQLYSDDATGLLKAASKNYYIDKNHLPVILVKKAGTPEQLHQRELNHALYSIIISIGIVLLCLYLSERFKDKKEIQQITQ